MESSEAMISYDYQVLNPKAFSGAFQMPFRSGWGLKFEKMEVFENWIYGFEPFCFV